ncbi:unnamed protein product [Chrysoparadoxa australica]
MTTLLESSDGAHPAANGAPSARELLLTLDAQRRALELEAQVLTEALNSRGPNGEPPVGVRGSLVDNEGFPLPGHDLFAIRQQRHQLARIQTDHKEIMQKIEKALHAFHEETAPLKPDVPETPPQQAAPTHVTTASAGAESALDNSYRPFARVNSVMFNHAKLAQTAADADAACHQVAQGSPAEEAGLRTDDMLLCFGSANHTNHRGMQAIVDVVSSHLNQDIMVWVQRGESKTQLVLNPHAWGGQGVLGCHLLPV